MPLLNDNSVRERVQYPLPLEGQGSRDGLHPPRNRLGALREALPALSLARLSSVLGRVPRAVRLAPVIALGLAALLASGCASSVPVRLAKSAQAVPGIEAVLEDAGELLGRPVRVVPGGHGAVTLSIVTDGGPYSGEAIDRDGCRRSAWAEARPGIVAHELGHTLGLAHDSRPRNLMRPRIGRGDVELTAGQRRRMSVDVAVLNACAGRARE